jgi:hypothetical protein
MATAVPTVQSRCLPAKSDTAWLRFDSAEMASVISEARHRLSGLSERMDWWLRAAWDLLAPAMAMTAGQHKTLVRHERNIGRPGNGSFAAMAGLAHVLAGLVRDE